MANWDIKSGTGAGPVLSTPMTGAMVPGGFWRRFVAQFIDQLVIGLVTFPVNFAIGMVSGLGAASGAGGEAQLGAMLLLQAVSWGLYLVAAFLYYGLFYSKRGATPGKMVMGLRVVDSVTGANVTLWKAFFRETIGKLCSTITLLFGYIMVGMREDKKALHDLMFGTQVLHKK